ERDLSMGDSLRTLGAVVGESSWRRGGPAPAGGTRPPRDESCASAHVLSLSPGGSVGATGEENGESFRDSRTTDVRDSLLLDVRDSFRPGVRESRTSAVAVSATSSLSTMR